MTFVVKMVTARVELRFITEESVFVGGAAGDMDRMWGAIF